MPWIITGIIISYFIGSIPTAYIFGRLLKGIDIRKSGSGNVGATNAFRVLGRVPGITVLILDIFKGFLVTLFLGNILRTRTAFLPEETLRIFLGLSCICGHNWTVFLNFKGGKGIATTLGVLLGLAAVVGTLRIILILLLSTWLLIFLITRIVSIASIITGLSLPVYTLVFKQSNSLVFLSLLLCIFVVLRHRSNLRRILQGKEPRLF